VFIPSRLAAIRDTPQFIEPHSVILPHCLSIYSSEIVVQGSEIVAQGSESIAQGSDAAISGSKWPKIATHGVVRSAVTVVTGPNGAVNEDS
jgi:hypothetical protein